MKDATNRIYFDHVYPTEYGYGHFRNWPIASIADQPENPVPGID